MRTIVVSADEERTLLADVLRSLGATSDEADVVGEAAPTDCPAL